MKQLNKSDLESMSREEAIENLDYLINLDYHLNSPIIEIPNFVPDSDCDYIREKLKAYMDKNPNQTFSNTVRQGDSLTISKIPELQDIEDYLYENFSKKIYEEILIKSLYYRGYLFNMGGDIADNGYDFHHYESDDYCTPHSDDFFHTPGRLNPNKEKVFIFASCALCLNTPNTGGELNFTHLKKSIKSEKGKVIIWSPHPFYHHYTTPTENDFRDVIVTWMQYSGHVVIDNEHYRELLGNE